MNQSSKQDSPWRAYLLGTATDGQERSMEERFLEDDAAFEELEAAETELLDDYTQGALTEDERAHFERLVAASPRLQQRVVIARDLQRRFEGSCAFSSRTIDRPPDRAVIPRWLLAAAVALVAIGGSWLVLTSQTGESDPKTAGAASVTFELTPTVRGAGGGNDFVLPPEAKEVVLTLPAVAAHAPTAVIKNLSGAQIWSGTVTVDGERSLVRTPAASLKPGDYLLVLSSSTAPHEVLAEYAFRVR